MPHGKKDEELNKNAERLARVLERELKEAMQKVPPDRAPGRMRLIDLPKGEGNGHGRGGRG